MPITADFHAHSVNSFDGHDSMESLVVAALERRLDCLCFTEHMDKDYQIAPDVFHSETPLDMDAYKKEIFRLQEKYAGRIDIGFGIEIGMQPHLKEENSSFVAGEAFDFVIASKHMVGGSDPYYFTPEDPRTDDQLYRQYFEEQLKCMESFDDFDVYGHLDYVVRYGRSKEYAFDRYADLLIPMLDILITKGKGIELNTCAIRKGLREMNPCCRLLREYRNRGGEVITVGSDAHWAKDVAGDFAMAEEILRNCGFDAYCTFSLRQPIFHKL